MTCETMTILKCNPAEVEIHASSFVGLRKLYLSDPGTVAPSF